MATGGCDEKFTVMTLNMNGPVTAEEKREAVVEILTTNNPDIVCAQEIGAPKKKHWKLENLPANYTLESAEKEAGIMWNHEKFTLIKYYDAGAKQKIVDRIQYKDTKCPYLVPRSCIVTLQHETSGQKLLVISWHGPQKKIREDEKIQQLEGLLEFAKKLSEKEKTPVFIGGDFNLDSNKIQNCNDFKICAPKNKTTICQIIDYFIISNELEIDNTCVTNGDENLDHKPVVGNLRLPTCSIMTSPVQQDKTCQKAKTTPTYRDEAGDVCALHTPRNVENQTKIRNVPRKLQFKDENRNHIAVEGKIPTSTSYNFTATDSDDSVISEDEYRDHIPVAESLPFTSNTKASQVKQDTTCLEEANTPFTLDRDSADDEYVHYTAQDEQEGTETSDVQDSLNQPFYNFTTTDSDENLDHKSVVGSLLFLTSNTMTLPIEQDKTRQEAKATPTSDRDKAGDVCVPYTPGDEKKQTKNPKVHRKLHFASLKPSCNSTTLASDKSVNLKDENRDHIAVAESRPFTSSTKASRVRQDKTYQEGKTPASTSYNCTTTECDNCGISEHKHLYHKDVVGSLSLPTSSTRASQVEQDKTCQEAKTPLALGRDSSDNEYVYHTPDVEEGTRTSDVLGKSFHTPNQLCYNSTTGRCEDKITVMTLNMKGKSNAAEARKAVEAVLHSNNPDIVCAQGIGAPKQVNWKLNLSEKYKSNYKSTENVGVLWNGEHFDEEKIEIVDKDMTIKVPNVIKRTCIVKLQNRNSGLKLLVISWHGPYNKANGGRGGGGQLTDAEKIKQLKGLLEFSMKLSEKENASILIGGTFNLASNKIPNCNDFKKCVPEENTTIKDYFIISNELEMNNIHVTAENKNLNHKGVVGSLCFPTSSTSVSRDE